METITFSVEASEGPYLGEITAPALPQEGDLIELVEQQITFWRVRQRRFSSAGGIVVIVEPAP